MSTLKEFLHNLVDHVGAGSLHQQIDDIEEPKAQESRPYVQRSDSSTSDPANQSKGAIYGDSAPDGPVTDTGDGTGKEGPSNADR